MVTEEIDQHCVIPTRLDRYLQRPRLFRLLSDVDQWGTVVLSAPVGYGKTTLLGQWARRLPERVHWLTGCLPGQVLQDAVGAAGEGDVVIVDGLGLSTDDDVAGWGELATTASVRRVRLVVSTRDRVSFDAARAETPDPLVIDASDLAFRSWETDLLFRHVYRAPLSFEANLDLSRRTEGWPAALHLLSKGQKKWPGREPGYSEAEDRPISWAAAYLHREVLSPLEPACRDFLSRTATLRQLTTDSCDALLGTRSSAAFLRELECRPAVLSPWTPQLRVHSLVRELLIDELAERVGPSRMAPRWHRATQLLLSRGDVLGAASALARTGDTAAMAGLVRQHPELLTRPDAESWLPATPTTREPSPLDAWAMLTESRRCLADGRTGVAAELSTRAVDGLEGGSGVELCVAVTAGARSGRPPWDLVDPTTSIPGGPAPASHAVLQDLSRGDWTHAQRALVAVATLTAEPSGDAGVDGAALLAHLVIAAVQALVVLDDAASDHLLLVQRVAHRTGQTWIGRVAHAIAMLAEGGPSTATTVRDLAAERHRVQDLWGAAVLEAAVAVRVIRDGRFPSRLLDHLVRDFRELACPALEAWTRAAIALQAATAELPEAREAALEAEAYARAAGIPGARAVAFAALAETSAADRSELRRLAWNTAREGGMTGRPWTWPTPTRVPPRAPAASHVDATAPDGPHGPRPASDGRHEEPMRSTMTSRPAPPSGRTRPRRRPTNDPVVAVQCLGGFRVSVDGQAVELLRVRPVARATLRLLALHAGRPVHRDEIVEAIWGDRPSASALHNLHVALSSLRSCLEPGRSERGGGLIERDGEAYVFAADHVDATDLQRFDTALGRARVAALGADGAGRRAALSCALDLYAGDVLPMDGPAEWVVPARERYKMSAAEIAAELAEMEMRSGDPSAARLLAVHSLHLDPWRDAAWRVLMEAHQKAGDVASAERTRRDYSVMLRSLGVRLKPDHVTARPVTERRSPVRVKTV